MSLTQDDLQAIKGIVEGAVDDSKQHTAAGFTEMQEKLSQHDERFDQMDGDLNRIENKLDPTIEQVEGHEARIGKLESSAA